MALSDCHLEIRRLTELAKNKEKLPELRINAARKLLRDALKKDGNFSTRGIRLGKRVSKLFMTDESVSVDVRQKASSLYQYVVDQTEREGDEGNDGSNSAELFVDAFAKRPEKSHAEQLAEKNADWNVYKYNPYLELEVPAQWIYYRTLEDLAAYNIPADPRLTLKGHLLETLKLFIDGDLYYLEPDLWWEKVSNPLYLKALNGRKVNWSGCCVDTIDADGKIIKNTDGQIS